MKTFICSRCKKKYPINKKGYFERELVCSSCYKRKKWERGKAKLIKKSKSILCATCGKEILQPNSRQKTCSKECAKIYYRKCQKEQYQKKKIENVK